MTVNVTQRLYPYPDKYTKDDEEFLKHMVNGVVSTQEDAEKVFKTLHLAEPLTPEGMFCRMLTFRFRRNLQIMASIVTEHLPKSFTLDYCAFTGKMFLVSRRTARTWISPLTHIAPPEAASILADAYANYMPREKAREMMEKYDKGLAINQLYALKPDFTSTGKATL